MCAAQPTNSSNAVGERPSFQHSCTEMAENDGSPALSGQHAVNGDSPKLPSQLLIVVGEAFSESHKELIIRRLTTELIGYGRLKDSLQLDSLLDGISTQPPKLSTGSKDESVLEWDSSADAHVSVLVNPRLQTTIARIRQFLSTDAPHRYILYAGSAVAGVGNWLLQDGPLRFADFDRASRDLPSEACDKFTAVDLAVFAEGEWSTTAFKRASLDRRFVLIPAAKEESCESSSGVGKFVAAISSKITAVPCTDLLQATDVVGVIPFHRPTMYIFQGGEGTSSILGIRGFTLLVDGGYPRHSCFWEFARHLDRIDSAVVTHLGANNLLGIKSFVERLVQGGVATSLASVFLNAGANGKKHDGDGVANGKAPEISLQLSLAEEAASVAENLRQIKVPVISCVATGGAPPINLYYKIGFGSLDMHMLTPMADSKELKEFITNWGHSVKTAQGNHLAEQVAASFVVVFKPTSKTDHPVRILFPGSAPQAKIFEGLDRLKTNNVFQTSDGVEKSVAAKTEKPASARPAGNVVTHGKPAEAKTAATPRDAGSAKPDAKKPANSSETAAPKDHKKTAPVPTDAVKNKQPAKAAGHAANGDQKKAAATSVAAETKDSKASIATSTPKKDAPKPAPPKVDPAAARNGASSARGKKPEEAAKKTTTTAAAPKPASAPAAGKPGAKKVGGKQGDATKKPAGPAPVLVEGKATKEQEVPKASEADNPVPEVDEEVPQRSDDLGVELPHDVPQDENIVQDENQDPAAALKEEAADDVVSTPAAVDEVSEPDEVKPDEATTEEIHPADEVAAEALPPPEADSTDFDPSQSWDAPLSLPAPADKDGEIVEPPLAPATTEPAAAVTKPAEPANKSTVAHKEKSASATKRPGTGDRLNQTIASKPGGSETARSANGKTNRLSLQPKDLKPMPGKTDPVKSDPASKPANHAAAPKKNVGPTKPVTPFYVDLAYIPLHAADTFSVEFFQRVRARNYVLPGASADPLVLAMLVDAKASWDGEVTLIPTGDTDDLIAWATNQHDRLAELKITVAPSVSRSSLHLENGSTCSAYRLEF